MLINNNFLSIGVYLLSHAVPTSAWDYVPNNQIVALDHNHVGGAINKFHPMLKVQQGCVPYPAVDTQGSGRVGEGLNPTGAINGGCSWSQPSNVYARAAWVDSVYGIYYAWYFPKDQIAAGPAGHRHDWEGFVVWTTGSGEDASIRAICPARHGTSQGDYHCDTSNFKLDGNRPKIIYRPDGTHAIFTDGASDGFGSQNLAFWDWMPQLARDLLGWADYGSAQVPILDWNFENNMRSSKAAAGI